MVSRFVPAIVFAFLSCASVFECAAAPGDLDTTFGNNGVMETDPAIFQRAIAVQNDGKVVLVGGGNAFAVSRYRTDGSLDTSFNGTGKAFANLTSPGGSAVAECVCIQSNGKIVVAGGVSDDFGVARFLRNGALDTTFNGKGWARTNLGRSFATCMGVGVQSDGKIVVAGTFSFPSEVFLVRYNVNGSRDMTFGGTGVVATGATALSMNSHEHFTNLVIQPDDKILTTASQFTTTWDIVLARYNRNGTPDTSFNGTGKVFTHFSNGEMGLDVALQHDGKIVVSGIAGATFGVSPNGGDFAVARYLPTGELDTTFNGTGKATVGFDTSDPAWDVEVQPNGKIIVVGMEGFAITGARLAAARFLADGTLDTAFAQDGKLTFDDSVGYGDCVVLNDGKILISTGQSLVRYEGDPTAPEMSVQQPVGTHLVDESSTVSYDAVAVGANASKTFTIRNVGNAVMSGIAASLSGLDAGDFTVTTNPLATLPAFTGVTTVTVRFNPTVAGAKSAVLHITSDDPDESSFDIDLTGNALPLLSFGNPIIRVAEDAETVNIPIVRTGGNAGAVTVNLSTVNGTAVSPADFTGLSNQLVTLGEGVGSVDVPIAIDDSENTNEINESFTVKLSSPNGAVLAAPSSATVVILDSVDTTRPKTPVITAPLAGAVVPVGPGGTVTIKGTAADNQRVESVEVSLDGVNFVPATITPTGAGPAFGTTATFSVALTPASGLNTVVARTVDMRGNVSLILASRTFKVTRKLVVNVDPLRGGVTSGFSPWSWRDVGRSYTIAATPKSTGIFAGWTIAGFTPEQYGQLGIVANALQKPSLTFIFREGLELTAKFENNPYDDLGVAGTYNGLVNASPVEPDRAPTGAGDEDGTVPGMGTEGHFTAQVLATGTFSGKLTLDGAVLPVAGAFDHEGRARFGPERTGTLTITRTGKPSLLVNLDIGGPPDSAVPAGRITGAVSALDPAGSPLPVSVSLVAADRAHYNGTAGFTVPDAYLTVSGATRADGVFTVVLPSVPRDSQPKRIKDVLTEMDYPQGSGVGSIRVTKAGLVTLTATLADGTAVTATSTLSQGLRVGLFARLYTLKGFLSAPIQFNTAEPDSDLKTAVGGEVLWSRPFNSASHYYAYGWAETLELDLLGAKYAARSGQSVLKAANGADLPEPHEDGNVKLTFTDGQLSEDLLKFANVSITDSVTKVPSNDPTFSMTVNRTTGAITGIFDHSDGTKPAYNAVIIQKGANARARGFFLTKQPTPIDYTGESGHVLIEGAP